MKKRKICKLGKLILIRLSEMGKSQAWLADATNLCDCSISFYISGRKSPSIITISKLSDALGIKTEKIIEAIAEE